MLSEELVRSESRIIASNTIRYAELSRDRAKGYVFQGLNGLDFSTKPKR